MVYEYGVYWETPTLILTNGKSTFVPPPWLVGREYSSEAVGWGGMGLVSVGGERGELDYLS